MADLYGMRGNPLVEFDTIKLGEASQLHKGNPALRNHRIERVY